jgi:hypothetical protein
VALYQSDGSRHYIREYTVTSADTYEYITVTFPGDASGTINNDTGAGFDVYFPLVTGSTYQNTADTWAAGQDWSTSSAVNCMDNNANNFYLTGVQLEVGSVATDYAHEDYGTTLQRCRRYYHRIARATGVSLSFAGSIPSAATFRGGITLPSMRAAPTFTNSGVMSQYHINAAGSSGQPSTLGFTLNAADDMRGNIDATRPSMTQHSGAEMIFSVDGAFFGFSAEL